MTSEFSAQAQAELEEAYEYYERQFPGLGAGFKSEAQHALMLVVEHPRAWKPVGNNLRQCRLNRFPYALIYGVHEGRVIVIAVANLKRRPGYWRKRMKRR
jgi:plasmid stabilization system protein ParE